MSLSKWLNLSRLLCHVADSGPWPAEIPERLNVETPACRVDLGLLGVD